MATLNFDDLGALYFPPELDDMWVVRDDPFTLKLNAGGYSDTWNLTPNDDGEVKLCGVGGLLADIVDRTPQTCSLQCDAEAAKSFKVLPCRRQTGASAEEFCRSHFLTMHTGRKRTYGRAVEYLSFYKTEKGTLNVQAVMVFTNVSTGEVSERTVIIARTDVMTNNNGLYTVDVSPRILARLTPEDCRLAAYEIQAGKRTMAYAVEPVADAAPVTLCFRNNFGQWDTFHFFGNVDSELKPERSAAAIDGQTKNYRATGTAEFTGHTGPLAPGAFALFADLCMALEVRLGISTGRELTITGNECKLSNDRYAPQSGTLTWRHSDNSAPFADALSARVFDATFDTTFE